MEQENVKIIDDRRIIPRSIQEDEIPRDGGRWPEYCSTMILCVDEIREGLVSGRLHSFCRPLPIYFHSLDQLLFGLEELLDDTGLAEAWEQMRSYPASRKRSRGRGTRPELFWGLTTLHPKYGGIASFSLRIYARQHVSMQGVLVRLGGKDEPVYFRSALELAHLIRDAVEPPKEE